MDESILKKIGKHSKIIVFGSKKEPDYDPLEDLIGIVKLKRKIDVEELLASKGLEDARKHIEF